MTIPPNFQRIIYEQQERELTQAIEHKLARHENKDYEFAMDEDHGWLVKTVFNPQNVSHFSLSRLINWLRGKHFFSN